MKRLTKRCNGVVTYIGASNEYETGQIACEVSPQGVRELLDRLAAFEDTKTEPEEIAAMRHTLDEYHKVADPLLLAKAQGRLAMLLEGSETCAWETGLRGYGAAMSSPTWDGSRSRKRCRRWP